MKTIRRMWVLSLLLTLMVAGCAPTADQASAGKGEKEQPKNRKLPIKMDEILKREEGKYAGDRYDKKKVERELDKIPKNASEKEIFNRIVDLIGEDFRPEKKAYDEFDTNYAKVKKPGNNTTSPSMKGTNIAIVLDSSGSMSSQVGGGQKMKVAKEAVQEFVSKAPKDAKVSLIAYGHKGGNSKADKKASCAAVEEVYPLKAMDKERFQSVLNDLQPTGWTPLAGAIKQAKDSFATEGNAKAENVVFVVSDGLETCGGDPAKEAEALTKAHIKATVNIIGFDVNNQEQQTLQAVAEAGGGTYFTAQSKEDLKQYFHKQYLELQMKWIHYNGKASGQLASDYGSQSNNLVTLNSKITNKHLRENNRFDEVVGYMLEKRELDHLNEYSYKRYSEIDNYFSARYSKVSNEIDKGYQETSDQVDKNYRDGFDSTEKKLKNK
ncbi:vWA domain-containing protein [Marininema halotolerans]|uniref:Ca-activated chloride channel family protein n=1 Tax=Marininema halotolerans TaxID=1155944 RepID=A0A1I6TA18_9BACL|nr:VWA domain-containing protein [Marininema halotolerans]SFS85817.1 Ca-activated chloride channel family protein [Marininema halotolerans]